MANRLPKSKEFAGKQYHLQYVANGKLEANREAKNLRETGSWARITKELGSDNRRVYAVWERRGKKVYSKTHKPWHIPSY